MHGRVVRLMGDPAKTDESIKTWTQQVLPMIKKQKGFAGVSLLGNRKTGDGLSVSYWETEQAMKDARPQIRPDAEKVMGTVGGRIVEEDECEVAVQARFEPPKSGVWVRVTTVEGDPAKVDQGISDYKTRVVPVVQQQPGGRAAILLVNRKAGKSISGTIWNTEKDLQNSEAAVASIRREVAEKVGAKSPKVEAFEVFYTEILAPALTRR
jgi:Antibiotic biosynthesis monooxygenase